MGVHGDVSTCVLIMPCSGSKAIYSYIYPCWDSVFRESWGQVSTGNQGHYIFVCVFCLVESNYISVHSLQHFPAWQEPVFYLQPSNCLHNCSHITPGFGSIRFMRLDWEHEGGFTDLKSLGSDVMHIVETQKIHNVQSREAAERCQMHGWLGLPNFLFCSYPIHDLQLFLF